nr:MAG TPA: signalosome complex subunit 7a protein [Caudoviricetes sp.]
MSRSDLLFNFVKRKPQIIQTICGSLSNWCSPCSSYLLW